MLSVVIWSNINLSYVSVGSTFKNKVELAFNVPTIAHLATSLERSRLC